MFPKNKDKKTINVKEWFIIIENQQSGPYSLLDLKRNLDFTPDTLVWKKGFKEWIKARFVPEMQQLFEDEGKPQALHESEEKKENDLGQQQSQATLTLQQDPYQFFLWILLLLILIFYTFYQFYYNF